jgi:hypothetical protein
MSESATAYQALSASVGFPTGGLARASVFEPGDDVHGAYSPAFDPGFLDPEDCDPKDLGDAPLAHAAMVKAIATAYSSITGPLQHKEVARIAGRRIATGQRMMVRVPIEYQYLLAPYVAKATTALDSDLQDPVTRTARFAMALRSGVPRGRRLVSTGPTRPNVRVYSIASRRDNYLLDFAGCDLAKTCLQYMASLLYREYATAAFVRACWPKGTQHKVKLRVLSDLITGPLIGNGRAGPSVAMLTHLSDDDFIALMIKKTDEYIGSTATQKNYLRAIQGDYIEKMLGYKSMLDGALHSAAMAMLPPIEPGVTPPAPRGKPPKIKISLLSFDGMRAAASGFLEAKDYAPRRLSALRSLWRLKLWMEQNPGDRSCDIYKPGFEKFEKRFPRWMDTASKHL